MKYVNLDFDVKNDFYFIFTTCENQIGPKIKNAADLLKFGTFDIPNIPISIKNFFFNIYHLFRPKLVSKLKVLRNYWNLAHSVFQTCWPRFWRKNLFLLNTYHLFGPKWVPKLKVLRIYWNLAHLIFQICRSRFWCQKWFLLNIYHLLGPSLSQN